MVHIPYRCPKCASVLVIHCGGAFCSWLKCANARCRVDTVDLEHGWRVDRDGKREAVG
jgi:hypothetical protein